MATMLGFVATDAVIAPALLPSLARAAADASFNRITIDGDTSTNDSFVLIATQRAGNATIESLDSADGRALRESVFDVSRRLAQAIVRDGEGATKFVEITVDESGALDIDAHLASGRDDARDEPLRVRKVEGQRLIPRLPIDDLGTPMRVRGEDPLLGIEGHVARQDRPHQRPRHQIAMPVPCKMEPPFLLPLRRIEQRPIGRMQAFIGNRVVKAEPDMNLGGGEGKNPVRRIMRSDGDTHGCTSGRQSRMTNLHQADGGERNDAGRGHAYPAHLP
jgi:hypothetical protein